MMFFRFIPFRLVLGASTNLEILHFCFILSLHVLLPLTPTVYTERYCVHLLFLVDTSRDTRF